MNGKIIIGILHVISRAFVSNLWKCICTCTSFPLIGQRLVDRTSTTPLGNVAKNSHTFSLTYVSTLIYTSTYLKGV